MPAGLGHGQEPLRTRVHERGQVDGLVIGGGRVRVETSQEEKVLDDVAQAFALSANPAG